MVHMMRRAGAVAAWITATLLSMAIAASAVGAVRGGVTDIPEISEAAPLTAVASSSTSIRSLLTTTSLPTSTTTTTATTTPSSGASTTTVASSPAGATTTSTIARQTTTTVATTTTTTQAAPPHVSTYQLIGGQVTISASAGELRLVAAVPAGGFSAEIKSPGPNEVEVEFESSTHKSTFRARWDNGQLDIDIDEEEDDD